MLKKLILCSGSVFIILGCTEPMIDDSSGERVTKTPDIVINVTNQNTNNIDSTHSDNVTFIDNNTLSATATANATSCSSANDNVTDNRTDNCTSTLFFDALIDS